jgi:hypothetical protein
MSDSLNIAAAAIGVFAAAATWAAPPSPTPGKPPATLAAAEQRIDALIGDAACRGDEDCSTSGIGWLACGGPQAWRAWSRAVTDATALDEAVAAHRALRQKQIARTGEMSVCALVADPGAFCETAEARAGGAGHCRPRRGGRGGAAIR